ncbi:HutD family protein [Serratia fonticola]|uniref:HutD/Ves family protein n=1 Tax=Serratia fonticola TaxID=47917 RepID=UPI0008FD73BB|nr:HutD family protein [Serratia fonticola]MBC3249209.1 HutD family protein [Serratia fonticola]OIX95956.1 HutD family protein [Serratia fonticola]QCR61116.1 HutD family protein [Serratia fonticola]
MKLNRFDFADLPVSPWRNGGGETREITCQPPGNTEFGWRASIATIAQNGPFSAFNGIDRSITLLEGDGVHLFSEGLIDHRLQNIGEPFAFSGDVALEARLLGGSCQDFNIMTRRGHYQAQVQRIAETIGLSLQHAGVLYVLRGQWQLPDGKLLAARQGCWWLPGDGPLRLVAQGNDARALWADIVPATLL